MDLVVLNNLTESQLSDLQLLLNELVPGIVSNSNKIKDAVSMPGSHVFAAIDEGGIYEVVQ